MKSYFMSTFELFKKYIESMLLHKFPYSHIQVKNKHYAGSVSLKSVLEHIEKENQVLLTILSFLESTQ